MTTTAPMLSGQLPESYRRRLDQRLREERPDWDTAERLRRIEATVEFLRCCALPDAPRLSPSPLLDPIWHEMLMFTAEYREFCRSLGVDFIDHEPLLDDSAERPAVAETVAFMRSHGVSFEDTADLWLRKDLEPKCCSSHVRS